MSEPDTRKWWEKPRVWFIAAALVLIFAAFASAESDSPTSREDVCRERVSDLPNHGVPDHMIDAQFRECMRGN